MSSPYATINWQRQRIFTLEAALRASIEALEMVRDADADCRADCIQPTLLPPGPLAKITAAVAWAQTALDAT